MTAQETWAVEVTVVVESYNYGEGMGLSRLRHSLRAALSEVAAYGTGEVLLTDVDGGIEVLQLLEQEFPSVRRVVAIGLSYDGAKGKACNEARGEFIAYLDGDCLPQPGWLKHLLAPLKRGECVGVAGFTRYEGGYWAALQSVMDFGFILRPSGAALPCYSSNNVAFVRAALLACPLGDGSVRCGCYEHAQRLLRQNTPMRLVAEARVTHALPPFLSERYRRGFDLVGVCWDNPALPEARLLRGGVLVAPFFYGRELLHDVYRTWTGRRALRLPLVPALAAMPLYPVMRVVDFAGIVTALARGAAKEAAAA